MIFIKNVNVVLEDRIIYDGEVLICGDKIEKNRKKKVKFQYRREQM